VKLRSRKLWVGATALVSLCAGFVFVGFRAEALPAFSAFATAVVTLAGLYFGGNVAAKLVNAPESSESDSPAQPSEQALLARSQLPPQR